MTATDILQTKTQQDTDVPNGDVKIDLALSKVEKEKERPLNTSVIVEDPWAIHTEEVSVGPKWTDLSTARKVFTVLTVIARFVGILVCLYFFICSLSMLGSSFQLLGGRTIGSALRNSRLLRNPFCGLVIGIMVTAILQSSSTSTSIVVTMVASGIMDVKMAIPIVMGANIGTSVTGIIVSVVQSGNKNQFRRAFGAATVHDMFNWLSVIILLPIEALTHFLYHLTKVITDSANLTGGSKKVVFLKALTNPFTNLIVQLDKKVLHAIAIGDKETMKKPLLKYWCKTIHVPNEDFTTPDYSWENITTIIPPTRTVGVMPCCYLFHGSTLPEAANGAILLVMSLSLLISCLLFMVKILKSLLSGSLASVVKKTINANFPYPFGCFTGYVAMLVGCVLTVLVQSSSIIAATLTPLVGIGMVTVDRVYPMMLGANIGTTSTAFIAAFAASGNTVKYSFQVALCHLFFNLLGIAIWYPLPFMRKVPISLARFLGNTTAQYRWFAFVYLIFMFFLMPLTVFALSIPGWYVLVSVLVPIVVLVIIIGIMNCIQNRKPKLLPQKLRTWEFLPRPLRSLEPYDRVISKTCFCCKCCRPLEDEDHPLKLMARTLSNVRDRVASVSSSHRINLKSESAAPYPSQVITVKESGLGMQVNICVCVNEGKSCDSTCGRLPNGQTVSHSLTPISDNGVVNKDIKSDSSNNAGKTEVIHENKDKAIQNTIDPTKLPTSQQNGHVNEAFYTSTTQL